MFTLQGYALDDHITSNAIACTLPSWWQMDNVIVLRFFNTLTVNLQEMVHKRGDTVEQALLAIKEQLGNCKACTIHHNGKFWISSSRAASASMTATER
jgi:hypothetical protein